MDRRRFLRVAAGATIATQIPLPEAAPVVTEVTRQLAKEVCLGMNYSLGFMVSKELFENEVYQDRYEAMRQLIMKAKHPVFDSLTSRVVVNE